MAAASPTEISSPFAIVLAVFERYKRSKLVSPALAKVEKKYGGSSEKQKQLLVDLTRKYGDVPCSVSPAQLSRILAVHDIPSSMRRHFEQYSLPTYDATLDVLSSSFDATKALRLPFTEKRVISSLHDHCGNSTKPRDNMTKLRHLMVMSDSRPLQSNSNSNSNSTLSTSTGSGSGLVEAVTVSDSAYLDLADTPPVFKAPIAATKAIHPFERIALQTLQTGGKSRQDKKRSSTDIDPEKAVVGSTYALLYKIMQEKCKAHVIIRRRNR
jgi:hypothetical protein